MLLKAATAAIIKASAQKANKNNRIVTAKYTESR